MLKLTYTDTGIHLERLIQSVEELVITRVILAMRVGQGILIESSTASFLLPATLPGAHHLEAIAQREDAEIVDVCDCDFDSIEITLQGTWIAINSDAVEGVFVTALSDRTEFLLLKLWQEAQAYVSCAT